MAGGKFGQKSLPKFYFWFGQNPSGSGKIFMGPLFARINGMRETPGKLRKTCPINEIKLILGFFHLPVKTLLAKIFAGQRSKLYCPTFTPPIEPTTKPATILIIVMRFSSILSLVFLGLTSIAFAAPRPMKSNSEGVTPSSSETISQAQNAEVSSTKLDITWVRPAGSITRVPQDPRTQQNIQKGVTKFFADEKVRKVLGVTGKLETTFPVNRCEYYGNNPGFGQSVYKGKMVRVSFGGLEICGGTCTAKVVIGVGSGGALKVQGRIYNSATKLIFPVIPENKASERSALVFKFALPSLNLYSLVERSRKNLVRRGVSSAGFEACRLDWIERRAGLAVLH
ncbi:hypothetical protein HHX47_DHR5000930 [Lentinula edodes]|nr:hypothetical protein HHX47_DHR5000930 [Lentinula edodes]